MKFEYCVVVVNNTPLENLIPEDCNTGVKDLSLKGLANYHLDLLVYICNQTL